MWLRCQLCTVLAKDGRERERERESTIVMLEMVVDVLWENDLCFFKVCLISWLE